MVPLAVRHMLDKDVGDGFDELTSGQRVDGDTCLSWSCVLTPG